jgi:hypothetical protein
MLRTLIADVTLISEAGATQLTIGIRWQSGASEQLDVQRPHAPKTRAAPRSPRSISPAAAAPS